MSLRRSQSSMSGHWPCDQWEAEMGAALTNQRAGQHLSVRRAPRDSVTMVTSGQRQGERVSQQLCVPVTRPVTETISADTPDTVKNVLCCYSMSAGLVSVRQTFSTGTADRTCTVTETIQLWTSICLNSLRQTDGGIEPAVLGIFAVQCNIQAGEALLCLFIICKKHWAKTWILKSLSVLTIHMVVKIRTDN